MNRNIVIVHYNTPELTTALIRSINKHTPGCKLSVFDNSDSRPLGQIPGVEILDNTHGQLIDFESWLAGYHDKLPYTVKWGSEKHILSVEYMFKRANEGFVLMDSDVLVKHDISCFFDDSVAWKGQIEREPEYWFKSQRLLPFILWINVPMCKRAGVRFQHEGQIYKVSHTGAPYYDTGGSFYFDCMKAGLPGSEVLIGDYIEHLLAGSHHKTPDDIGRWLAENRNLYE